MDFEPPWEMGPQSWLISTMGDSTSSRVPYTGPMRRVPFSLVAGAPGWLILLSLALAQPVWKQRALELLDRGRVQEARTLLLETLGREAGDEEAQALLGQIAFTQKDYPEAALRFSKAPSVLRANPLWLVNYGEALLETRQAGAAKRILEGIADDPRYCPVRSGSPAGAFRGSMPRANATSSLPCWAIPTNPRRPITWRSYNTFWANTLTCANTLENLPQRFKTGDVFNLLALAYLELEEFPKAWRILQQATRDYPTDERNYVAIARLATEAAVSPSVALDFLDRGLAHLPDSHALHIQRAYLKLSQGRYREAASDYEKAIQLQPNSEMARLGLAFVLVENQQHDEATVLLEQTLRKDPANFYAHYLLGDIAMTQGSRPGTPAEARSLRHLRQAAALKPDFVLARISLGKLYLKRNDLDSAIRELETSIRLDPQATTAYYQLSIAYRKAGAKEKALAALQQVRRLNREERKLGTDRFLYRKLKRGAAQLYTPR